MNLCDDARLALDDLFHFGKFYWGLQLEEQPHRWMCDELMQTLTNNETPNLLLDVPRGCYKTSVVTAGAVLQYLRQVFLFDNPYHRILYASATLALGDAFLSLIENVLRAGGAEGRIDRDFGKLWKSADRGNRKTSRAKDGITLAPRMLRGEIASVRDPNFFIASIRKPRVGFHADGAILDDLNDKDNVRTPERLRATQEFYRQIYPLIATHDRVGNPSHVWMTCTPWKDDDVRGMIMREEEEKQTESLNYVSPWRIVKATAHMPDGSLFFPSKLTEERLDLLKDKMRSEYWAAYEGQPVSKDEQLATEDQIRFKPREEFPPLRWHRITVDPNQHNDARILGCYAAIILGGFDKYSKLWIWDIRASREWGPAEFIDELYAIQSEHPTWPMFMEDSHMSHFDHAVNLEYVRRMDDQAKKVEKDRNYIPTPVRRLNLNWVSPHKGMSKYEKWAGLKPRFQAGAITFAQEIAPSLKSELMNELTRGRAARFKDILDALAMMENGITPRYKMNDETGLTLVEPKEEGSWRDGYTFASQFPGMVA